MALHEPGHNILVLGLPRLSSWKQYTENTKTIDLTFKSKLQSCWHCVLCGIITLQQIAQNQYVTRAFPVVPFMQVIVLQTKTNRMCGLKNIENIYK